MLKSERTQQRILDAARAAFARKGFAATSLQAVADEAGVDKALCVHYFGSKAGLFAAAMQLPVDVGAVFASVTAEPEHAGRRFVELFLSVLDDERARTTLVALIRSAASDDAAAAMVRGLIAAQVVGPAVAALDVDQPDLRATLVGSQLIGFVFARHVVGVEPLATASSAELADALAPNIQRYLTGALR
jgi:AcrR family transcriptional regulator